MTFLLICYHPIQTRFFLHFTIIIGYFIYKKSSLCILIRFVILRGVISVLAFIIDIPYLLLIRNKYKVRAMMMDIL